MKKDNINLLENYQLSEKKRKNQGSKSVNYMIIFIVTLVLLGAYSTKLFLEDLTLKATNSELQDYVSSPNIAKQILDISTKQRRLTDLNAILNELKSLNASFEAMPKLDSIVLAKINSCIPPDTTLLSIDYDGQWFTFKTRSSNFLRPSEFARNLKNLLYFEEVNYYGYHADTGNYFGTVLVAMKVGK